MLDANEKGDEISFGTLLLKGAGGHYGSVILSSIGSGDGLACKVVNLASFSNIADPQERKDRPSESVGFASPPYLTGVCSSVVISRCSIQSVLKLPHLFIHIL